MVFPDDEDASSYDGALSHTTEWHAFVLGFGAGFSAVFPSPRLRQYVYRVVGVYETEVTSAMAESQQESWYAVGGAIAGVAVGLATIAFGLNGVTRLLEREAST